MDGGETHVAAAGAVVALLFKMIEKGAKERSILLRLENPKISWIDDAKVVGDGIAIDTPVFRHFIA
jgi:hypothetical protein